MLDPTVFDEGFEPAWELREPPFMPLVLPVDLLVVSSGDKLRLLSLSWLQIISVERHENEVCLLAI